MNNKKTTKKQPSSAETMYPGRTVAGYEVEPWGMVEIVQISGILLKVIEKCKAAGIKLSANSLAEDILKSFSIISEELFEIMAYTVGDSVENIKAIKPRCDTVVLLLVILQQNMEYLKNCPGLIGDIIAQIRTP